MGSFSRYHYTPLFTLFLTLISATLLVIWYFCGTTSHYSIPRRDIDFLLSQYETKNLRPRFKNHISVNETPTVWSGLNLEVYFYYTMYENRFIFPPPDGKTELSVYLYQNSSTYDLKDFVFYLSSGYAPGSAWGGVPVHTSNTEWLIGRESLVLFGDGRHSLPRFTTAFVGVGISQSGVDRLKKLHEKSAPERSYLKPQLRFELSYLDRESDGWLTAPFFYAVVFVLGSIFLLSLFATFASYGIISCVVRRGSHESNDPGTNQINQNNQVDHYSVNIQSFRQGQDSDTGPLISDIGNAGTAGVITISTTSSPNQITSSYMPRSLPDVDSVRTPIPYYPPMIEHPIN